MGAFERCHHRVARQEAAKGGGVGGKIKLRLSEVNITAVSRGQGELLGKLKMAAGDVISIRGNSCWNVRVLQNYHPEFIIIDPQKDSDHFGC